MHKLWIRITLSFLLLLFLILLGSGFFLAELAKTTYFDLKENQLYQNATLAKKALAISGTELDEEDLESKVKRLADEDMPRITIIDKAGNVLADSLEDPEKMGNHAARPEFRAVLTKGEAKGISIRHSDTLGTSMMYVTVPVYEDEELQGAIRASITLHHVEKVVRKLWLTLSLVLFSALLLTAVVGMRLAKGISSPIEEMIAVSERLDKQDFTARVQTQPKGELGQLAEAINSLASNLKRQMKTISENEHQLKGVLENMMSGVLLVNKKGKIRLVNRAMSDMLGAEEDALIGRRHAEAGKSAGLSLLIDRCLKSGKEIKEEIHLYTPEERILNAHLAPYLDDQNEMRGIIAVLHDITDIRRLEKMRSEFVANVSHELRTPITSVKGFAETLLDGAMEDEELLRSFLTIIYDESDRLHRLINDILDLSKIEQHREPLAVEAVNLTEALYGTVELVKEKAAKKNITLSLPPKKAVVMEGEKDRIQQILLNLFSNAISYTSQNGRVAVMLEESGESVEVKIADNGIGIAKQDLSRIFERFYRVDRARTRDSGSTGLGLAIVKHLVDAHHGTIKVESEEGMGTAFVITFPKKQPD